MDFEFYRNFLAAAELGNLTVAAHKLAIAQPALSAQIKTLEQAYGVKLIVTGRGRRGFSLTEAGREFLRQAQELCQSEERLQFAMRNSKRQASGLLRFSTSPAKSSYFLQRFLLPFSLNYQQISFQVQEEAASEQLRHLLEGTSDFAYANAPLAADAGIISYGGRQGDFYAVYKADGANSLPYARTLEVDVLRGLPLCCNSGCYALLRRACTAVGFQPNIRFMATVRDTVLEFAQARDFVAIVPAGSSEELPAIAQHRKLNIPGLDYRQQLLHAVSGRMTAAVQAFIDFYKQQVANN